MCNTTAKVKSNKNLETNKISRISGLKIKSPFIRSDETLAPPQRGLAVGKSDQTSPRNMQVGSHIGPKQ